MNYELITMNEPELATQALLKKKNLNRQQAVRYLASRGFSWSTIEKVLKKRYNDNNVND